MTFSRYLLCAGLGASLFLGGVRAFAADAKDPLKDAGLTKSGDVYVLPDDATVIDGVKSLRATKVDADKESKARKVVETQIAAKKKVMKDADKEWHELEGRLSVITDVGIHNRLVIRMNRLVLDHKQAMSDEKDLEEKANKLSSSAKMQFVDGLMKLAPKADAAAEKYKALAADASVTGAIAKQKAAGGAATSKLALGPTAEFTAAVAELKKWQSEVESEAIPMRDEAGNHTVDVLINGEHHFTMGVDTGSTDVSISAEVAEQLKMVPGEKDPVIHIQLADGNIIEGREMSLRSVRVGRFTVEEVRCVVLDKAAPNAPLLLGSSFLNHFVVKLDPAKNELHLTEIKSEGTAKTTSGAGKD